MTKVKSINSDLVPLSGDRFPLAEVWWEDFCVEPNGSSTQEVATLEPVLRSTVGYTVGCTDECLILATDLYAADDKTNDTPMVIPWSSVLAWCKFDVH
jgi:hypothetical protein